MTTHFFDIETARWSTFVLGAAVCRPTETRDTALIVKPLWSIQAVREWYLSLPEDDTVLAHFGGGFDFVFLVSILPELSWQAGMAGASAVWLKAKGHARCQDSMRLFPLTLSKWTGAKGETGVPCTCGRQCGGYCAFDESPQWPYRRACMDYCVQDCIAGLTQWLEDTERLASSGFDVHTPRGIRGTIGGVAWHTAAAMGGLDPNAPVDWEDYEAGRLAYYGGRCEVGQVRAPSGREYDVRSMYPWALSLAVPIGSRRSLVGPAARAAYERGLHGSYRADVILPETDIPLLPHRAPESRDKGRINRGRLLWATGAVSGHWTAIELSAAENTGARIVSLDRAHVWESEAPIFEPYVSHVYSERRKAIDASDARWGGVLKWFANSLSGKLAMRPEVTSLRVLAPGDAIEEGWQQCGSPSSRVWCSTTRKPSSCALTHVAAALTARARVKLLERLLRHSGTWLYCDTDSTYLASDDDTDTDGEDFGTWADNGAFTDWRALAPKLYRFRADGGKGIVKARGIPGATWDDVSTLEQGGKIVRTQGIDGLRRGQGAFQTKHLERAWLDAKNQSRCGTRFVNADGRTRPLHAVKHGDYR